ncbi:hypothetical protein ZIOFF_000189 [Zingiber officinale]|uniref:Uncharacterized protein n=1 Tax=Zingiber officinale TaxID=94328 RepID=A0A8J5I499_ZINOF|nr:hypothetical protein ZIOFF_000189 [Zingiber officinale]
MSNRGVKDIASNKGRSRGRGRHRYQSLRIQDEQLDTMPELDNIPNEVQEEVERQILENDVINDARYEEDREMKKVWNENASERYRATIHLAKKAALSSAYKDLGREPNMLDMIGRGPEWMEANIWNDLVKNHWNKEDHKIKCDIARKNKMIMKDGSITKHTGGSISFGAHRERMKKELGREVDEFEIFERMHKRKQGTAEFVDNKSARVSEQYRERQNVDGHSTNPSFNLQLWCDVVGGQYKGRVYGFGRNQHFRRSYNESSNEMCSNEKNKELSQEIEDMRTTSKRMENEIIESKNKLELVITENRQREEKLIEEGRQREEKLMEEGRQREENLKEMIRKMIQEVGYTNHLCCPIRLAEVEADLFGPWGSLSRDPGSWARRTRPSATTRGSTTVPIGNNRRSHAITIGTPARYSLGSPPGLVAFRRLVKLPP